jgi:hypothetical protein
VKLSTIHPDDIVLADIRGGRFYAIVDRVADGEVWIDPLIPVGYHRITARQVAGHWRKAKNGAVR